MVNAVLGIIALLVIASGTFMLWRKYRRDQKAHQAAIDKVKAQKVAEAESKEKPSADSKKVQ